MHGEAKPPLYNSSNQDTALHPVRVELGLHTVRDHGVFQGMRDIEKRAPVLGNGSGTERGGFEREWDELKRPNILCDGSGTELGVP